ncbi:hypothetical protein SIL87_12470 [Acidiphilium acidophilum]|uniref:Uncharacterized protein n=2 Tax=Acidiphilium acidophilum TaxID=76588 RepID=A0AAW9DTE6_ACIAO|nr:hypothetical protein [Acidiphilium acidophilum]
MGYDVAEVFEKRHDNIVRDIESLLEPPSNLRAANKSMGYDVAELFEKRHDHVMQSIGALLEPTQDFGAANKSTGTGQRNSAFINDSKGLPATSNLRRPSAILRRSKSRP